MHKHEWHPAVLIEWADGTSTVVWPETLAPILTNKRTEAATINPCVFACHCDQVRKTMFGMEATA